MAENRDKENPTKPVWRAPKVDDLGNLRDFVRTHEGHAKSGASFDEDGGSEKRTSD